MELVTGSLLRFVLDFTTSEELLGVFGLVQDDTETSGHIAEVTVGIVVDVLA